MRVDVVVVVVRFNGKAPNSMLSHTVPHRFFPLRRSAAAIRRVGAGVGGLSIKSFSLTHLQALAAPPPSNC